MKRSIGLVLVGLLFLAGCTVVTRQPINVTPGDTTLAPGETQEFTASASGSADFTWTADAGTFDDPDGATVTYTAPEEVGEYTVTAASDDPAFDDGTATVTVSLTEEVEPVTANADDSTPVSNFTLESDEIVVFEVDVSFGSADVVGQAPALYFELDQDLALSVYDEESSLYATSSSAAFFAEGTAGLGEEPSSLSPQGISIARQCRGSCVIQDLDVSDDTYYLKVKNNEDTRVSFNLYAFVDNYSDTEEPSNNEMSSAPSLVDFDSGAIESLGDVDFFQVATNGDVVFSPRPDTSIDLQAEIIAGDDTFDLEAGERVEVIPGDFVRVFVLDGDEAAAASRSGYDLEIE